MTATAVMGATTSAASAEAVGDSISFTANCTASRQIYLGQVRSTVAVTFRGKVDTGNRVRIERISYAFGPAEWYVVNVGYAGDLERGNDSDINVTSPVSRTRAGLPPTGSFDVADFHVDNDSIISAKAILDIKDNPDPSCVASVNASWSTK